MAGFSTILTRSMLLFVLAGWDSAKQSANERSNAGSYAPGRPSLCESAWVACLSLAKYSGGSLYVFSRPEVWLELWKASADQAWFVRRLYRRKADSGVVDALAGRQHWGSDRRYLWATCFGH